MPMTPPSGGNLWVYLDVGFSDGFTLNDAQQGKLDSAYRLDGTTEYAELNVKSIDVFRGKRRVTDSLAPGRATIVASDPTRLFDPYNKSSIYYNEFDDSPGLSPMRRIYVKREVVPGLERRIFTGRVVSFTYDYVGPKQIPQVTMTCADDFFILANSDIEAFTPSEELSSDRIETILDLPEVDWPLDSRNIDPGVTTLGAYAIPEGTNVLDYLRQIDRAERGRIFIEADTGMIASTNGMLTSQPRLNNTFANTDVVAFTDSGVTTAKTATPYREVLVEYSTDTVLNRVTVQRPGGVAQTVEDTASITDYFTQAETIAGSLLSSDVQALTLANYLLAGTPEPRFSGVVASFLPMSGVQRDACLIVDMGRNIKVTRTFATGTPATVTEELTVEGIGYRVDFRDEVMTFYTAPTTIVYELELDDATFGKLDSNNALT